MPTLRKAADMARKEWSVQHPFALSDIKYLTDRRKVIAQASEAVGDRSTWELATGQYLIWETIEASIAKGVVFDPSTDLALLAASTWRPSGYCPRSLSGFRKTDCRQCRDSDGCTFRSEEHTSELQSLMRNSYAVFCLKKKNNKQK